MRVERSLTNSQTGSAVFPASAQNSQVPRCGACQTALSQRALCAKDKALFTVSYSVYHKVVGTPELSLHAPLRALTELRCHPRSWRMGGWPGIPLCATSKFSQGISDEVLWFNILAISNPQLLPKIEIASLK